MSTTENKQLMQQVFDALAHGNVVPFRDAMAENVRWSIIGSTPWSGTYRGRDAVLSELMGPLFAQFVDRYVSRARRIIAEDDHVVVECRGRAATTSGASYRNTYCYVCRLAGGKLVELTEYCDTDLIARTLTPPS